MKAAFMGIAWSGGSMVAFSIEAFKQARQHRIRSELALAGFRN
jgi:hypothetical protein